MKILVAALFLIMLFMHQDFWWWEDDSLVLGFMPIGLAFHALFSVLCAVLGGFAILTIWPKELDESDPAPAAKKEGDA
ncbi:MAG: DUF3311 domain-containing protein [Verrucomicrobiota bacterium]